MPALENSHCLPDNWAISDPLNQLLVSSAGVFDIPLIVVDNHFALGFPAFPWLDKALLFVGWRGSSCSQTQQRGPPYILLCLCL